MFPVNAMLIICRRSYEDLKQGNMFRDSSQFEDAACAYASENQPLVISYLAPLFKKETCNSTRRIFLYYALAVCKARVIWFSACALTNLEMVEHHSAENSTTYYAPKIVCNSFIHVSIFLPFHTLFLRSEKVFEH